MKMRTIVVGAGGLGRELAASIAMTDDHADVHFVDDGDGVDAEVNGFPVLGNSDMLKGITSATHVFLGLGLPAVRRKVYERLRQNMALLFPNHIHRKASVHQPECVEMGEGNILCDGVIITTNVTMGSFNLINLASTIGHDVRIGDFCSIMPGVNISGGAKIGSEVYIGTGARLIKATHVGDGAVIGAGSVVNTDIPAGETWAGVPAKRIS